MSTIENGKIFLYCHFNKIIKGAGNSFQYPVLSQKHVRNVCHTVTYFHKFHFKRTLNSKEISISVTFIMSNVYDDVTYFEICRFHKKHKNLVVPRTKHYFFFK